MPSGGGRSDFRAAALSGELSQRKFGGQRTQQPVFLALHLAARGGLQVVVPAQMQKAMHEVTGQFRLPRRAKLAGLRDRVVDNFFTFLINCIDNFLYPEVMLLLIKDTSCTSYF